MNGKIGDSSLFGDPHLTTRIRIQPDTRITISLPRTTLDGQGEPMQVPFHIDLGYGFHEASIAVQHADLIRLRDTINEALAAGPREIPDPEPVT